ncbi:hypothetical protein K505DRAFT_82524 [Melanomma pulvis-pyrius CBS 109.77]|uniref:Uncharacterized protein n=1 Tax=Melanomma pulvis-pyrius CBS 109.77 TaxID=1314802 RepID=A0A6A6X281_9PLEO|nr:hypothetical protein K505DRAFT_82524 [Melanomma pulvis-pyrius CBS 109.77]
MKTILSPYARFPNHLRSNDQVDYRFVFCFCLFMTLVLQISSPSSRHQSSLSCRVSRASSSKHTSSYRTNPHRFVPLPHSSRTDSPFHVHPTLNPVQIIRPHDPHITRHCAIVNAWERSEMAAPPASLQRLGTMREGIEIAVYATYLGFSDRGLGYVEGDGQT